MEREGSLPHSQELATRPYSEPGQSSPYHPSHFLNIYVHIIPPSTPRLHVPSLMSRFHCWNRTTVSVQARGNCELFVIWQFYGELLAPRQNSKQGDLLLSAARYCLFNIYVATLHIGWSSSMHNLRTRHTMVTGTHLSRSSLLSCQRLSLWWLLKSLSTRRLFRHLYFKFLEI
jgi:hypothetical protein